jgi:DNA-binding response OmpR family regulator
MMKISRLKVHIMKASWLDYLYKPIYLYEVLARIPLHKVMSSSRVYIRCRVGSRVTMML